MISGKGGKAVTERKASTEQQTTSHRRHTGRALTTNMNKSVMQH